jgi:hypothetical protein
MIRRLVFSMLAAGILAGCGAPTLGTPSAKDVLAKPQQSNLKDAHFMVTGKITDNGLTLSLGGDGLLLYKPKLAGRFTFQTDVGGQQVTIAEISVDGMNYGMTPASTKWSAQKGTSGIDPSAFAGATDMKYLGEETLSQGKVWHASAKDKDGNAFEAYIRESDGYPVKYVETQTGGQNITLSFDKYNTGVTISAPPADQIETAPPASPSASASASP